MKYYITDYKTDEAKKTLKKMGLFCYDLRDDFDNSKYFATIEDKVIVNRGGSIITTENLKLSKEYPNNFIDFNDFAISNEEVSSFKDLKEEILECQYIDLKAEEDIDVEFYDLFSDYKNYNELNKNNFIDKRNLIIEFYEKSNNYFLIELGGYIYAKVKMADKVKSIDKELKI